MLHCYYLVYSFTDLNMYSRFRSSYLENQKLSLAFCLCVAHSPVNRTSGIMNHYANTVKLWESMFFWTGF